VPPAPSRDPTEAAIYSRRAVAGYRGGVSVADERYPELHRLIERLEPEQAAIVREQILRLVTPPRGLSVLGVFDGPEGNLGEDSEEIIRSEAGQA
jgi:hypothetical protein